MLSAIRAAAKMTANSGLTLMPLVADGKVYLGDEDGDIAVLQIGKEMKVLAEIYMRNSVYGTPVPANGVLYIMTRSALYAIATGVEESEK